MIDADEQPLRQTHDQTLRIWGRVRQGMSSERRRFRRHALLSAVAGGVLAASLLALLVRAPWREDASSPAGGDCPVVAEAQPTVGDACP